MGWVYAGNIEKAVRHLLPILETEKCVRYSRFYDGTDECHEGLNASLGVDDYDCAELLMDLAAYQLEELGIVRRVDLEEKLSDGETDYRIELVTGAPTNAIQLRDMCL
jgi:hypothetical protein